MDVRRQAPGLIPALVYPPPLTRLCAANSRVVDGFRLALLASITGAISAFSEPAATAAAPVVATTATAPANSAESPAPVTLAHLLATSGRFVTCLAQDSAGRLWIGAEEGSLTSIADGKAETSCSKNGLADDSPLVCVEDGKNGLWIGNRSRGLSHFDGTNWRHFGVLDGLGGTRVYDLTITSDAAVWCATENGVSRFDGQAWQRFSSTDGLPPGEIAALAADSAGRIWAGGAAGGLAIFADGTWQQRPADQPVRDAVINDILVAKDGTLWVATNSGLFRANPETNSWAKITHSAVLKTWTENVITCLAETATGTLLCGTRKYGVLAIDKGTKPDTVSLHAIPVRVEGPNARAATFVRAILSLLDDTILVGTYGAGAVVLSLPKTKGIAAPIEPVSGLCPEPHPGVFDSPNPSRQDTSRPLPAGSRPVADGLEAGTDLPSDKDVSSMDSLARTVPTASATNESLGQEGTAVGPVRANRKEGSGESKTPRQGAGQRPALVSYLGEDWQTQGDWIGAYGSATYVLPAMGMPNDFTGGPAFADVLPGDRRGKQAKQELGQRFSYSVRMGPNRNPTDSVRYWTHAKTTDNPKSLQNPTAPTRRQSSWDDAGELYPPTQDGPDLYLDVSLPPGEFVVSLYFVNIDCLDCPANWMTSDRFPLPNRFRDYAVEVMHGSQTHEFAGRGPVPARGVSDSPNPSRQDASRPLPAGSRRAAVGMQDNARTVPSVVLARARVREFAGGGYKRFLMQGAQTYTIHVARNGSHNVVLSGVFVDPAAGLFAAVTAYVRKEEGADSPGAGFADAFLRFRQTVLNGVPASGPATTANNLAQFAENLRLVGYSAASLEMFARIGQQFVSALTKPGLADTERQTQLDTFATLVLALWKQQNPPDVARFRCRGWEPCPGVMKLAHAYFDALDARDTVRLSSFGRQHAEDRALFALTALAWQALDRVAPAAHLAPADLHARGIHQLQAKQYETAARLFDAAAASEAQAPAKRAYSALAVSARRLAATPVQGKGK